MTAQADAITTLVRSEVAKASDWQLVTVKTVNSDGTCDVTAPDGSTTRSGTSARRSRSTPPCCRPSTGAIRII